MKVKCKYCDSLIDDTYTNCPNCGAALDTVQRFANKQPQTIEELQKWYTAMKLPAEEVTRFFIGKDIKEPRAFGIYNDADGDFVVYKNKSDGSRAVRYQGTDEAYAVNEIYQRLKEEIVNQKDHNAERRLQQARQIETDYQNNTVKNRKRRRFSGRVLWVLWILVLFMLNAVSYFMNLMNAVKSELESPVSPLLSSGYYSYEGSDYYLQGFDWYYYDASNDEWEHTVVDQLPEALANDYDGYYRIYDHEGLPFEYTSWYQDWDNYSSYDSYDNDSYDWDDDYGWDSNDSWDSYDTDWDSDW